MSQVQAVPDLQEDDQDGGGAFAPLPFNISRTIPPRQAMPTNSPTLAQEPPEVLGGQFTLWPEAEPHQVALDFCNFPGPLTWTFLRRLPPGDTTWRTVEPWVRTLSDQATINARQWIAQADPLAQLDARQIEMEFLARHC